MAEAYKRLYQGQPGTSITTIYTVPAATNAVVKNIRIVNMGTASATIQLWHGGTTNANVILPATTLQPGEWGEFDGLIVAPTTEVFSAQASLATTMTVTMYGLELT
jgi:hypothetical protein